MTSVKLKRGAVDKKGISLEKFVDIEFDCYLYKDYVVVRNHRTKGIHEVEYKYVEIIP